MFHISKQNVAIRMEVKHLLNINSSEIIWPSFLLIIMNKLLRKPVLVRKSLFHLFWYWFLTLSFLGGDYMIPVCRHEISPRPAGTDLTLRLHVEIKFRPGKAGQFSTWHLFRFVCNFFEFFFVNMSVYEIENP